MDILITLWMRLVKDLELHNNKFLEQVGQAAKQAIPSTREVADN